MTYLSELIGQVLESLLRNKLRTFLTMAGIAWGIASIVLVVTVALTRRQPHLATSGEEEPDLLDGAVHHRG